MVRYVDLHRIISLCLGPNFLEKKKGSIIWVSSQYIQLK